MTVPHPPSWRPPSYGEPSPQPEASRESADSALPPPPVDSEPTVTAALPPPAAAPALPREAVWSGLPAKIASREHLDAFLQWCRDTGITDMTIQSGSALFGKKDGSYKARTARAIDSTEMSRLAEVMFRNARSLLSTAPELDFSYDILLATTGQRERFRYRVNMTKCADAGGEGYSVTMRALPTQIPDITADLGVPTDLLRLLDIDRGINLICGVMESGKTWLLSAYTRHLIEGATFAGKVVHIGSPIEFSFDAYKATRNIHQIEIPRDQPSFSAAIRSTTRKSVTHLVNEETRDAETMNCVVDAADLGVAAYTTLHALTCDAALGRANRLLTADSASAHRIYTMMEHLKGIVCQRLAPRVGGGRVALREWLALDDPLRDRFLAQSPDQWGAIAREAVEEIGMPLRRSADQALEDGLISAETHTRVLRGRR